MTSRAASATACGLGTRACGRPSAALEKKLKAASQGCSPAPASYIGCGGGETSIDLARAVEHIGRLPKDKRALVEQSLGGDSFAWFLEKVPGCYINIGNGIGSEGGCMVHNAGYDFNDRVLSTGASYWVKLAEHWLAPQG